MNNDNKIEVYCPSCFQPMEIYDGDHGYACYCYNKHIDETGNFVNVGRWHPVPDWYLEKTKETVVLENLEGIRKIIYDNNDNR
jgi:hypothetical protein